MPRSTALIGVDEHLAWVVRVPEAPAGVTPVAPDDRALSQARFDESARAVATSLTSRGLDDFALRVVRLVLQALDEPPDLPFIGEPFGGEAGTD